MNVKAVFWALVVGVVVSVSGCDRLKDPVGAFNSRLGGRAENLEMKQFNAYVKAHNAASTGSADGLPVLLEKFKSQNLNVDAQSKGLSPSLYLSIHAVDRTVTALREAQAIDPSDRLEPVHDIGEKMLANAEQLLVKTRELDAYMTSRKFMEDNYAGLRAGKEEFVRLWTQFNNDHLALEAAVAVIERENLENEVTEQKRRGNPRRVARAQAMMMASDIVKGFKGPDDLVDKQKFKQMDPVVADLERVVGEIMSAKDDDKLTTWDEQKLEFVHKGLNEFIGSYRKLRASGAPYEFNQMVHHYNAAVRW